MYSSKYDRDPDVILADIELNEVKGDQSLEVEDGIAKWDNCNLRQIPIRSQKAARDIHILNLKYNYLEELPHHFVSCFQNLEELYLVENYLVEVPNDIGRIQSIKKLHLDNNYITVLPNSICNLLNLEVLSISYNSLTHLPDNFGKLKHLEHLDVKYNKVTVLPATFSQLVLLVKLDLSYNDLRELPHDFGSLQSLKEFFIVQNSKLSSLGPSFGNLEGITFLDASSCSIRELPSNFLSCNSIKSLDLAQNNLSQIPDWINHLPQLQVLNLQSAGLVGCPFTEEFGINSVDLVNINLSGNKIEKLPQSLINLTKLENVDIGSGCLDEPDDNCVRRGNRIKSLPRGFGYELLHLTKIVIKECQLQTLPRKFGGKLTSLIHLDLSSNDISLLPPTFSCMKKLRVCLLSNNCIEYLPTEFGKLTSLVELRLSHNKLSFLPSSFKELNDLKILDLSRNRLSIVPAQLARLDNLKALNLGLSVSEISTKSLSMNQDAIKRLESAVVAGVSECLNHSGTLNTSSVTTDSELNISEHQNGHSPSKINGDSSSMNGFSPSKSYGNMNGLCNGHSNGVVNIPNGMNGSNGCDTEEDWDNESDIIGNPGSFAPWYTTELDRGFIPFHDLAPGTVRHRRKRKIQLTNVEGQFDDPK